MMNIIKNVFNCYAKNDKDFFNKYLTLIIEKREYKMLV